MVQGVREVGIGGLMDDDADGFGFELNGRFGYFVVDGIEAGVYGDLGFRGSGNRNVDLGVFSEYNFDVGGAVVPHVGLGVGLGWSDRGSSHDTYMELEAWGGLKYFFVDYAAFGLDAALMYATEDVYDDYEHSFDWAFRFNTRWFF